MARSQPDRFLIVNADDFGLAPGVTQGILELARLGIVTSTSAIVTVPGSLEALAQARQAGLDVGVHLTLCAGAPLLRSHLVPSLVEPGGRFVSAYSIVRRRFSGRLRLAEVEREWAAQVEHVLAAGIRPSHLDSHCHLHSVPGLYRLTLRLARRYGIPGVRRAHSGFILQAPRLPAVRRIPRSGGTPDGHPYQPAHFSVLTVLGRNRTLRPLEALLRALPAGVTELVCHPGYVDEALRRVDPLTAPRAHELLLLARPHFREALAREGIRLVSWADAAAF